MLASSTFFERSAATSDIAAQFLPDSFVEDELNQISDIDDRGGSCRRDSIDVSFVDVRRTPDEFPQPCTYPGTYGYIEDELPCSRMRRNSIASIESVRSFADPFFTDVHSLSDYAMRPFGSARARRVSLDSDIRRMSVSSTMGTIERPESTLPFLPLNIPRQTIPYLQNELSTLLTYKSDDCIQKENHAWKRCHYAHGEIKRRNPYLHTYAFAYCHKVSRNTRNWTCPKGDDCKYAHSKEEALYHPLRYKTIECKRYNIYSQDGIPECENYQCAFYHNDPSPIVNNDGLKSLLLMVTDLTKYHDSRARKFTLTDRERLEFFKIVTGYDEGAALGEPEKLSPKDIPRAYLTLWLRGYFEELVQGDPESYENILFEDFMLTKADMTIDEIKRISASYPEYHDNL